MASHEAIEIPPGLGEDAVHDNPHAKPPPRKRRRLVISCTECHRRKQKCDRKLPCTNCISRNKESACRYETGKPPGQDQSKASNPTASPDEETLEAATAAVRSTSTPENARGMAIDFGYTTNGASTLGILKKIEGAGTEPLEGLPDYDYSQEGNNATMRERYKSLIRQLPARTYIERLVDIYLREVNWQYFGIDEPLLRDLMDQWYNLPFSVLSSAGPQALDPLLKALPALLFQLSACSLLYLPEGADEDFNQLKYASMTLEDLAQDYSDSGVAILSLLGKRQMSIITVLAGWVRAGFLKYSGMVTESWHQIGAAIRDAQEIGLHRDHWDPKPGPEDSAEKTNEKLWMTQVRRRTWLTLLGWDLHTGAVLGRPTSVDHRLLNRTLPVDVLINKDRNRSPLIPRSEHDPPSPLTRSIWSFECIKTLREILDLEKEGPFPKDFSRVDKIHAELLELQETTPGPFRLENPDTRFDDHPDCWWLPIARTTLPQLISFNLMALHRPYVFTRATSRYEALKASLDMLQCQRLNFAALKPHQFKTFALFFGTFDAIVMCASIYILFPRENLDLLPRTLQHFQWGVERFEKMAVRNKLAAAALAVLRAIYIRLKKSIGGDSNADFLSLTSKISPAILGEGVGGKGAGNGHVSTGSTPSSQHQGARGSLSSSSASATLPGHTPTTTTTTPQSSTHDSSNNTNGNGKATFGNSEWSFPNNFDFASLVPMYPMADIAYHDLTGVMGPSITSGAIGNPGGAGNSWGSRNPDGNDGFSPTDTGAAMSTTENNTSLGGGGALPDTENWDLEAEGPWQFGGDFGNDSIWNLLNQFPSS